MAVDYILQWIIIIQIHVLVFTFVTVCHPTPANDINVKPQPLSFLTKDYTNEKLLTKETYKVSRSQKYFNEDVKIAYFVRNFGFVRIFHQQTDLKQMKTILDSFPGKKTLLGIFVSLLLSASVERFSVSRMLDL